MKTSLENRAFDLANSFESQTLHVLAVDYEHDLVAKSENPWLNVYCFWLPFRVSGVVFFIKKLRKDDAKGTTKHVSRGVHSFDVHGDHSNMDKDDKCSSP
ncbi:hypothetical protein L2E82_17359 [Cichorium intybus]|uniref:Uncharacterized protein n=1 Tax=Cichorium intybus TaxID=13427 RepID=A0ACB9F8Z5_CICIN|nr:hypothetical protein L2E82_17359 [Cichorium intybus]